MNTTPVPAASAQVLVPQGGRCHEVLQGEAPLLFLQPRDPIPALSATFHSQLFAKHSPVLHRQQGDQGTTLRVSREEKQTQETPQEKQSFRAARCGGGRCAPSPLGIIPGTDPKPSCPVMTTSTPENPQPHSLPAPIFLNLKFPSNYLGKQVLKSRGSPRSIPVVNKSWM